MFLAGRWRLRYSSRALAGIIGLAAECFRLQTQSSSCVTCSQARRLTGVVHKAVAVHAWPVPTKEEEAVPHSSAGMAPARARGWAHRAGVVKEGAAGDVSVLNILPPVQRQAVRLKALQPSMQRCCAAS